MKDAATGSYKAWDELNRMACLIERGQGYLKDGLYALKKDEIPKLVRLLR